MGEGHFFHYFLSDAQQEGEQEYGIDGFHAELPAQHLEGDGQKDDVDHEEGVLHQKTGGIENNGAGAGQAACGDFVGQLKAGESQGVEQQAEGDDEVVAEILKEREFDFACHGVYGAV